MHHLALEPVHHTLVKHVAWLPSNHLCHDAHAAESTSGFNPARQIARDAIRRAECTEPSQAMLQVRSCSLSAHTRPHRECWRNTQLHGVLDLGRRRLHWLRLNLELYRLHLLRLNLNALLELRAGTQLHGVLDLGRRRLQLLRLNLK